MRLRPRLVLDTNILVSAFLWQGTPGHLIELAGEKEVQLFTSRALLDELGCVDNQHQQMPLGCCGK